MTLRNTFGEEPDPLSVLDMAAIQRIRDMEVDGQPSILEEVVSLYLELAPQLLATARQGLAENNSEIVFSATHQLKSMSAQLGTWQAAEEARQVEHLSRQGELSQTRDLLDKLDDTLVLSCEALRALR